MRRFLGLFIVAFAGVLAVPALAGNADAVAVIIGNKAYGAGVPEVAYAHRDAEAMKRFVVGVLGYGEANVIDLRDATQAQMLSTFGNRDNHRGKAFQYVRPGESDLLVYFSGHGMPGIQDRRGYLLPVDADPATAEINGYPIDLLYENLRKIGARSVTVMIDACFSGDSPRGMLLRAASPVFVKVEMPEAGALTVLTAASGGELASWDEEARHGLFTAYLLRALHGEADAGRYGNGDGQVTMGEVGAYLSREMTYRARRAFNRDQHPTLHGDDGVVLVRFTPGQPPARAALDEAGAAHGAAVEATPAESTPPQLVPVEALYVALKNVNVREEPTVASRRVATLDAGTEIHVAGKTADGSWLSVERDGQPLGFVHAPLLGEKPTDAPAQVVSKAPAAAPKTASGPLQVAVLSSAKPVPPPRRPKLTPDIAYPMLSDAIDLLGTLDPNEAYDYSYVESYALLLARHGQRDRALRALPVFDRMVAELGRTGYRYIRTRNAQIKVAAALGDDAMARRYMDEILRSGDFAADSVYASYADGLMRAGRLQDALGVAANVPDRSSGNRALYRDAAYGAIALGLQVYRRFDDALKVTAQIADADSADNYRGYVIAAMARDGRFAEAAHLAGTLRGAEAIARTRLTIFDHAVQRGVSDAGAYKDVAYGAITRIPEASPRADLLLTFVIACVDHGDIELGRTALAAALPLVQQVGAGSQQSWLMQKLPAAHYAVGDQKAAEAAVAQLDEAAGDIAQSIFAGMLVRLGREAELHKMIKVSRRQWRAKASSWLAVLHAERGAYGEAITVASGIELPRERAYALGGIAQRGLQD